MTHDDCIFCRIASGEIPSTVVYEDEQVIAFRDLHPVAPTHVLIVPKIHSASILELATNSDAGEVMAHVLTAVKEIASAEGIAESGCRLIANVGTDGGQTIFHTHFHLIGGMPLGIDLILTKEEKTVRKLEPTSQSDTPGRATL